MRRILRSDLWLPGARNRDRLIDGYRGVAVLCVVAAHALAYRFHPPRPVARLADPAAEMGVQLFFVISGYIITMLLLREEQKEGRVSIPAFYVRRAFRILPPLFCYYAALFIFRAAGTIGFDPTTVANSAAFTCNTGLTDCPWFVAHTWSLAVEEQYYLAWPLLLTLLPPRWRAPFLGGTIGFLVSCFLLLPEYAHSNWMSFACIAAGALYAASASVKSAVVRLSSYGPWFGAVALFALGHLYPLSKAVTALTPLLVLFILFAARELPSIRRILEAPPLRVVGLCSYSLYLWQQLFLGTPSLYTQTIPLVALPLVVALSYFFVEQPCARLGHRLSAPIKAKAGERRFALLARQPAEAPPL